VTLAIPFATVALVTAAPTVVLPWSRVKVTVPTFTTAAVEVTFAANETVCALGHT